MIYYVSLYQIWRHYLKGEGSWAGLGLDGAWAGWPNKIVPYKDRRWYDKWGSNVKFLNIVLLKAGSLKSCIEAHSLSQLIVIALMIVNSWDTQNKNSFVYICVGGPYNHMISSEEIFQVSPTKKKIRDVPTL